MNIKKALRQKLINFDGDKPYLQERPIYRMRIFLGGEFRCLSIS